MLPWNELCRLTSHIFSIVHLRLVFTIENFRKWTRKVDIRLEAFFLMLGYVFHFKFTCVIHSSAFYFCIRRKNSQELILLTKEKTESEKEAVTRLKSNEQFHPIHRRISFQLMKAVCKRRQLVLSLFGVKISKLKYHLIHLCRLIT